MPSMLTTTEQVIRQNCLCYFMERSFIFRFGRARDLLRWDRRAQPTGTKTPILTGSHGVSIISCGQDTLIICGPLIHSIVNSGQN
jgi:hypothetical protein